MPVSNPRKTVFPQAIDCGSRAAVTIQFDAAAALKENPADIILVMDRSGSMTEARLTYAKAAADLLIDTIAAASGGTADLGSSRMGIASFADTATADQALTADPAVLRAAVNALTRGGLTNHKAAFETAGTMLDPASSNRQIIVMFTDGKTTVGGDADPTAAALKAAGTEIFCIGLVTDPTLLNLWATDPDSTHVAYTDDAAQLDAVFSKISAEIVLAGALDVTILEQLHPDFKIAKVLDPSHGTVQVLDGQNLRWSIDAAGLLPDPQTISLTFEILHVGSTDGVVAVNKELTYTDRDLNVLTFPSPTLDVDCSTTVLYPEQCPTPTAFQADGCKDAVQATLEQTRLMSLGRIVQVDVTVRNVCPGKRVAVAVLLTETGPNGEEYARGNKAFTVPAHTGDRCRDITLRCISFVVPEDLDVTGDSNAICNERSFKARVMANYVDTDFTCCDADSVII